MNTALLLNDKTVGEVAAELPGSIRIFEAWRIDYCCGGRTPLKDACGEAGRTVEELAAEIAAAPERPRSAPDWSTESLSALRSYIVDLYHRSTREELETLQALAEKVFSVHGSRRAELAEVRSLVAALTRDMLPHMLKEEQILFPYVEELEQTEGGSQSAPTPFFGTVKNPVRMMMIEHDRVADLLTQLRAVTRGYTLPSDACFSYRELYRRLSEFEEMTHQHIHIENNIYFPRAVSLERTHRQNVTTVTCPSSGDHRPSVRCTPD